MNRWWFSIAFITTGVIMKIFLAGLKNANFDSNMTAFMASMAISIPFTLIAYRIYKKRMDYLGFTVDRNEKIVFVFMPVFWFLWIAIYIYGVYQGGPVVKKRGKATEDIHAAIMDNALMQLPGEKTAMTKSVEKGEWMKIVVGMLAYGAFIIGGGITYIFNIVEMLKTSDSMSTWSMVWGVVGVFFPPLGCLRGLLYMIS